MWESLEMPEEYLTLEELCERIKFARGTVRNLVWKKELVKEVHYVKPTPRKILFIWSAIEAWLHGGASRSYRGQRNRINI